MELVNDFNAINASLAEACGLALRQHIARKHYVLMTDAKFRVSGYAQMIEENDDKKLLSEKNLGPSCLWIERVLSVTAENVNLL